MKVQNPKLTSTITQQRNLRNGVTLLLTSQSYAIIEKFCKYQLRASNP